MFQKMQVNEVKFRFSRSSKGFLFSEISDDATVIHLFASKKKILGKRNLKAPR